MSYFAGTLDYSAKGLRYALMAETNAQYGYFSSEVLDHVN